jgi:integrase/recombinase XerD
VRRDHVTIAGRDEVHAEGTYYLEWWSGGERSREAAGADAFIAAEAMRRKQAELAAIRNGIVPQPAEAEPEPDRVRLQDAIEKYIEYIRYHRSLRTFRTYRPILNAFGKFCTRKYVDQVLREDLIAFGTRCLKLGHNGKTVYNKMVVISQLLKTHGRAKLLNAADWPSYVETVRPIYEDDELQALFAACTQEEAIRFKFYLLSGFRDAEGRHLTWRDVDAKHTAVRVTSKPHWGFHPKNWEEREVPVPQKLIALLQAWKPDKAAPDDPVFPSAAGNPDGAMLEKLKAVAWRAKLNCGHCETAHVLADGSRRVNRCSAGPFCGRWFLHKFRHTYATTMVYLKGVRNSDIQVRLNKGSIAAFA